MSSSGFCDIKATVCGSDSEGHDESGASCVGKATVACSVRARDAAQPPSLMDDPKGVTSEGVVVDGTKNQSSMMKFSSVPHSLMDATIIFKKPKQLTPKKPKSLQQKPQLWPKSVLAIKLKKRTVSFEQDRLLT